MRRGFTLIEGLLAVAVVALVSSITIPMYLNYQVNNDLNLAMEQTIQGLRRAQALSQAREGDSVWGFYVPEGTLYKGKSYELRNQNADEVYPMPSTITVSGSIVEVAYSSDGIPDKTGYITLTDIAGSSRMITILVPDVGIPITEGNLLAICHCPPGNPNNCNTLQVSENAWSAHQAHGDAMGSCPGSSSSSSSSSSVASSIVSSISSSVASSASSGGGGGSSSAGAGGGVCTDRFSVGTNGLITATGPVSVTVSVLGSQITYGRGGPEIEVYIRYSKNGGSSWSALFSGRDVDGGESQTVTGLVSGSQFLIETRGYFRRRGWLTFDRTYRTPDASGHLVVLRDGDMSPNYPAFDNQNSLASFLQNILDAQGRIDIGPYDAVIIGEIGVQNLSSNSSAVDFQDIVLKLEFTQEAGSCS